jgi:AraC-like DNA-binding protein
MYFTRLPDHTDPGFDERLHFSRFGRENIIFNAVSSKSHCDRHVGCLSIKTIWSGEEWYGVGGRRLAVRPGQFLVLNNDQEYSCRIDTREKVKVVSVFFQKEFAASVFRDVLSGEDALLDQPFDRGAPALEFFQTLGEVDAALQHGIVQLINVLNEYGYDKSTVDEHLVFLLHHLIRTHKTEAARAGRVYAVKPSTRVEIYKRLCIAKDLMHSSYMENPDLDAIGSAACLSTPQLVRHFKAVFQRTPHQYLVQIRLNHAAQLLRHTSLPVHEITWKCGFEDTSAFCRAFRTEYGVTPTFFRMAG